MTETAANDVNPGRRPMRAWFDRARRSHLGRVLAGALERWDEVDGDQRAAALVYFLLLSLIPLVFMLVNVGSLFVEREVATRQVVHLVNSFAGLTPQQEDDVLANVQNLLAARGKISWVAFALLIWGSLKFLRALIRTTNRVWRSPPYTWWQLPLKGLGLLGLTSGAALVGILVPGVAQVLRGAYPGLLAIPDWAFNLVFGLIPWVVLCYGILMVYKLAPHGGKTLSEVWLVALAVTVVIGVGQHVFLFYAANFGRYDTLYGTLGGGMAFLLWTYLSSCLCVFGVCACAALAELRDASRRG